MPNNYMHQDDKWGFKVARQSLSKSGLSGIEKKLRNPTERETLLYGFGLTNDVIGMPHRLDEDHREAHGCPLDQTFASHWSYFLGKQTRGIPNRNAEILVQTAYDIFVAAEEALWARGSIRPNPLQPVTEFIDDLHFRGCEFTVMIGSMRWPPYRNMVEEAKDLAGCLREVFPHYKRKSLRSISG
jgi:hypothetical protein